jgi:flagellar L-ring protein precursor FlgH
MRNHQSFIVLALLVLGCATSTRAQSLYSERTFRPLTADMRARQVGDRLTVVVLENASATSTADTKASNDNQAGVSGATKNLRGNIDLQSGSTFDGTGRTQRSGKFAAQLTVTVADVDGNGDLLVRGDQLIEINGEKQEISLEGRVRRADITEDNSVVSSRLADARIKFVGDGVVSERQRAGWISKVFLWLGL